MLTWAIYRWRALQSVFRRPWLKRTLVFWAVIGAYDLLGAQFVPQELAGKLPKAYQVIAMTSGWLPWWGWAMIGMALVTCAAVEVAARNIPREQEMPRRRLFVHGRKERDAPLASGYWYLMTHKWFPSARGLMERPAAIRGSLVGTLPTIAQAALDAKVRVWGKLSGADPYVVLPAEFWVNHEIKSDGVFLEDDNERWSSVSTEPRHGAEEEARYEDLMISRREFQEIDWESCAVGVPKWRP